MGERGPDMEKYLAGQFSKMEGEEIDPKKLEQANKRLRQKQSGKGEDGVIEIPNELEGKEKKAKE